MNIIKSACAILLLAAGVAFAADEGNSIDWSRARELHGRQQQGETLTPDDQAYLARVNKMMRERAAQMRPDAPANPNQQPPGRQRSGTAPQQNAGITAPSHVFTRGEVEILTFETEQDYDHLQE